MVLRGEASDSKGLHCDPVSLARQLICQRLLFGDLILPGSVDRRNAVLEGNTDVNDGDVAVDIVANNDVRS